MPKNITLAIDEELLQKARVLAALRRTTVNEMVRQFLEREVRRETEQAGRAVVWARLFEAADAAPDRRVPRQASDKIFDRDAFYGELRRERRVL